jgi:ammonia channel protein AmtB
VLGFLIEKTIGFTVSHQKQEEGLDYAEHGESAYHLT